MGGGVKQDIFSYVVAICVADSVTNNGSSLLYLVVCVRIWESLVSKRPKSYEDCIHWARLQFQARFHNEIAQASSSRTITANPIAIQECS